MDRAEPPRPVPSRSAPTGGPTFADEVAFLRDCAFPGEEVEVVETHLSWVVLTADRAHKLKRPVVQPYLDHRRLSARLADCRAEVALNQALAPGVYLGLESLRVDAAGELHLGGDGTVVDWLVVMRRLDREQLLDRRITAGTATTAELDPVVELLADFYRSQRPQACTPGEYRRSLAAMLAQDIEELTSREFGLADHLAPRLGAPLAAAIETTVGLDRRAGRLVDGHGDLRPEHVRPGPEPLIIDRLSFSASLRRVDPYLDLALLAVECEYLGAPALGDHVLAAYRRRTDDAVDDAVLSLYQALRAVTRARLSVSHLRDHVEDPQRWRRRGDAYLDIARRHLATLSVTSP
ncbi:hypothetical protein [Nodularia spumigena]|uniref:hypothetical protein n=1 Tax=Nodularia spumigena TaxID=70799 RepID=UPI002B219D83|nr:hypothetical protein [Nodularia spumigena]MEA5558042.1 hypothetical protein [Nodularia spumigena CH309]